MLVDRLVGNILLIKMTLSTKLNHVIVSIFVLNIVIYRQFTNHLLSECRTEPYKRMY